MHARIVLGFFCLAMVSLLAGCGGGGGGAPFTGDAEVVGRWLEIAPQREEGMMPDGYGFQPTRMLTLRDDGSFVLEEGAPENNMTGTYSAEEGALSLTRAGMQGTVTALAGLEAAYAFLDGQLIISEETATGGRAYRFARLRDDTAPLLVGEWLVARRLSAEGADLPCAVSTRLIIDAAGGLSIAECDGTLATRQGSVLTTASGHLGLRLPAAATSAGRLCLLGACSVNTSTLLLRGDDGAQTACARRAAPDARLVGMWNAQSGGDRLAINSDGTYAWTTATGSTTGNWRGYYGGYLCLLTPTTQRTFAASIWGLNDATLALGSWVPVDDTAYYEESRWRRAE